MGMADDFKTARLYEPGINDPDSVRSVSYKFNPPRSGQLVFTFGKSVIKGAEYVLDDISNQWNIRIMRVDHLRIVEADPPMPSDWQYECFFELVD